MESFITTKNKIFSSFISIKNPDYTGKTKKQEDTKRIKSSEKLEKVKRKL